MNGWLKWLPWFRAPVFVPGPSDAGRMTLGYQPINRAKPAPRLPELFECDCGRQHPAGWICNSVHRDRL